MTADIPCQPPRELRAGDSAHWRRSFTDYPASAGWVLAYNLISPTSAHAFTATADGDAFDIDLPASGTVNWPAAACTLVEYVTNGTARHTLASTPLRVQPNLAAATAGTDLRSPAQRMLDTIEAWMSTQSPVHGSMQYGDRRIDQYSPAELLSIRSRLKAEVANQASGGKGLVRRMLVQL